MNTHFQSGLKLWGFSLRASAPEAACALLTAALLSANAVAGHAASLLDALFQDHAVLQRDRPIPVWGEAIPGERISVMLASARAQATADASGHWRARLPAMGAGGPFMLDVRGSSGTSQIARDVLIGDVFLCSGQSNMELPIQLAGDSRGEIERAANDSIRMLTVEHAVSPVPLDRFNTPGAWQAASRVTVPNWSAVCFFFARELQKSIHVPIGLLHASWGGANIRPWMSAQALHAVGGYDAALGLLEVQAHDPQAAQARFAQQWETWWRTNTGEHPGAEPWNSRAPATRAAPESEPGWRPAPAGLGDWRSWGVPELRNFTGAMWYRTNIHLSPAQARAAVALELGPINQVDETWINGRAVGNTFGYDAVRVYQIVPGLMHAGDNTLIVNVASTYAEGGLLAAPGSRGLRLEGGALIPLGDDWQYRMVPAHVGYPPRAPWESVEGLSTMYNAMIAPLGPWGLRGVLWYQGESNTREAVSYEKLLAALMADWRHQFDPQLPFLIVQLPNFGAPQPMPSESDWAGLREAQRQAVAHDAHAALAVTIDLGEARNLHPTNKQDVGVRLARAARRLIYGEAVTSSGPVPRFARREGREVVVEFAEVDGRLVTYSDDAPIAFELCGAAAGSCRFVTAHLDAHRVRLAAPDGAAAIRVRYCWADNPLCNLYDLSGLPAGPFELEVRGP